ncbi:hypothetical protein [Salegentibacter salegens]|uniref:Uncharacterized protein n=1 Tax=Salegentibacter salegens TaxID=143223 RepID=A0A1M7HKA6_9FLAO|nr:hypothetical protein [Salegentibacter salegens]PRX39052.1 hypothetical protein LY58_03399 [Salegentibacter salegens]SHM28952.1 hypothetical protein SAMN05878281_0174 [Salegentibacter salegens]
MKNFIVILCFLLLGCYACEKQENVSIPPITAENTFSCKIDGEVFIQKEHGGFLKTEDGLKVNLLANNTWKINLGDGNHDLFIYLSNIPSSGSINIEQSDGDLDFFEEERNLIELNDRNTNKVFYSLFKSKAITIKSFTSRENLIFEFGEIILLNSENSSDTIELSQGKLNINLEILNE